MRKIVEILRLAREQAWSIRQIAASVGVPHSTVGDYLRRFAASGVPWPLPPGLDQAALEARLFATTASTAVLRPVPDWPTVHQELQRKGVTLELLWQEYKRASPDGYQYTRFCVLYRAWAAHLDPVLRQAHKAGEKAFVDYAGQTIDIVAPATGEVEAAQLFVGVLGASNYLYAEATWTQTLPDWIGAHVRMLEDFGGVPALLVPDNLRAGVTHACYYEPDLNRTYHDFAVHYDTAILPTRVARPRDKAKVESGVQLAERWLLAPLRHHTFTSLGALNQELTRLRAALNDRPFQKLAGSRRSLFLAVDRPALRPLPPTPYEFAEWRTATVNIDYHIAVAKHLYSVPYTLVGADVEVRLTAAMLEILHQGTRIAVHPRGARPGGFTTDPTHRPKSHQAQVEWSPSRLVHWGQSVGPATGHVVARILERFPHPEQGYRACLGLLSLGRRYTTTRLEAACVRAQTTGATSYKSVKSILTTGLDQAPLEEPPVLELPASHAHVRGAAYYRDASDPTDPVLDLPLTLGDL